MCFFSFFTIFFSVDDDQTNQVFMKSVKSNYILKTLFHKKKTILHPFFYYKS